MLPLFEMMMQAQNGEAAKAMAAQFGLEQDQITKAWGALLPAFSTGLKRNTSNPMDIGNFMQALSDGHHADYFDNMSAAFSPKGISEGNAILGHLFGSKEISRAVAQQAEQATGIAQGIFRQMLPVMASTLMGGLFKQASGLSAGPAASSGNIFADMFSQMMGQTGAAGQAGNPFGQMMENMFGGADGNASKNGQMANPFGDMMANMMQAGIPGMPPEPAEKPEEAANSYEQFFGQMFDAGSKVQQDYQKNMDTIFDGYLKGMDKQK